MCFVTPGQDGTSQVNPNDKLAIDSTQELTFDTYIVGSSNKFANSAAVAVASQNFDGFSKKDYNPLFIYGPSGLGKTHLALAVLNKVTQKGYSVYYNSASALLKQLEKERFGRSNDSVEEEIEKSDLIIIDDLGAEFSTEFTKATINELINNAILSGKPMIIISNLSIDELEQRYGQRVVSRLNSFEVIEFIGEDIRQLKK